MLNQKIVKNLKEVNAILYLSPSNSKSIISKKIIGDAATIISLHPKIRKKTHFGFHLMIKLNNNYGG